MSARTWAGLRAVGLLALLSGLVAGSTQLPDRLTLAHAEPAPTSTPPTPTPVTQTLLGCPGPESEGISGLAAVPGEAMSVLAATAPDEAMTGIPSAPAPGSLTVETFPPGAAIPPAAVRGGVISGALSGPATAEVNATGSLAAGVAAIQVGLRRDGDERGLQAAACQAPRSEVWLLAGGGAPTRRERLVVANPGGNALSVDIQVFGASGPIASVNGSRVAVPPHGRVGVLIDALAPGEPSPVVHVAATGGLVTALLEDSWIDGATGRGRDNVGPADGPATEQVIPAAFLSGSGTLRIVVPGPDEAVVESRLIGTTGALALPADGVVRVPGGSVRDIDLAGVAPGGYAVQVRSDRPVVAAVLLQRRPTPTGQSDLAWLAATPVIPVLAGTPVPPATTAQLLLVGTGSPWTATVYVVGADGRVTTLPAGGGIDTSWVGAVPAGASSVWVRPSQGTVRAGLVADASDAVGPLVTGLGLAAPPLTVLQVPVREVRR